MAKEICISSTPHETRLAILEDDQLAEIYYERENEYTLAGSIYNGRVTRVLPGMQSAFVDLGLERDAFLYVTDFIQLEDQEETDELERAAASGAGQAPREIRRGNGTERGGAEPGRSEEQKGARGSRGRRPGGRNDIPRSEERETNEGAPEAAEAAPMALEIAPVAGPQEGSGEEAGEGSGAAGGKRWRGRRHHRGRGPAPRTDGQPQTQTGAADAAGASEAPEEPEIAPNIHAAAHPAENAPEPRGRAPREPRGGAAPAPFVLPGESLSKYGGAPTVETPEFTPNPAAPPRPSGFSKPSTLVDAPLGWDGSGLLPGESLSRHRRNRPEPEPGPETEPETGLQSEPSALEVESIEDRLETALRPEPETVDENGAKDVFPELDEDLPVAEALHFEPEHESDLAAAAAAPKEAADAEAENPVAERAPLAAALEEDGPGAVEQTEMSHPENDEAGKPDEDASASHRVDPAAPTGFRIFGMGGKKKGEEPPAAQPAPSPATVTAVSAFAPGEGAVEEELIEGEEFETAPHHRRHKAEEGDFDDYEEQTLASQIQSGGLGEMLQEAHLDHKIQLDFDDKNGEDEDLDVAEEEEEEQPSAEAQPTPGKPRQDRGGRARRGRGAQPQGNRRGGPSRRSMQTTDLPVISDLLKPGQEILVQIAKEPIAKKGARITSHIALPGRFLVFMPTVTHVGVSRKIASDEERHRLKRILLHERGEAQGGLIVRTAAEGATEEELRADLRFLINLWNEIKQRSEASKSPALIYHDLSLIERILRDQVSANFSNIWVDSEADYERIVRFLNRFSPTLVRRVKLYTKETPLFEHFGIQDEISKALRSKVWLKSGGSIVINQTEALVAIDINTGKYVGKSARLEDTIVKTNLDAVPEIVRQIRLRDLGGIIVIDFIDMDERKNRYKVLAALEEALKADRAPTKVLQFNDFGLVAITRKRVKQSLERTLSVPCPTCQATGMVKSPITVCNEIYIEMRKMRKHFEGADVMLRVHPETVKTLKGNNARWLVEFEELTGKNLLVKSDPALHPEQFDIQG